MKYSVFLFLLVFMNQVYAYEAIIRKEELPADLESMLNKAVQDTGVKFEKTDFLLIEQRELATSQFTMYVQMNSQVPVAHTAVRIWKDPGSNELILGEMHLDETTQVEKERLKARFRQARFSQSAMKSQELSQVVSHMVTNLVARHPTDARILSMKSTDQWEKGDLVRAVEVRGRRGIHFITVSLFKNRVIRNEYREFPRADYLTLKANIFPIYEEVELTGERLPYEVQELRYIHSGVYDGGEDPFKGLEDKTFSEDHYSPLLAGTSIGEMKNLWSEASLRKMVDELVSKLPVRSNSYSHGLLLQGKFATINLHPSMRENSQGIDFDLRPSTSHMISWSNNGSRYVAKPISGLSGRPLFSAEEALLRIPFRHPDHDPVSYINSGADELQVYYAVTVLMESLAKMGFTDKGLSEKPFHAFLFDPDIGMKDNAYYYDDTINFTTYSSGAPNLARDNTTIWHELGHGVMDRLMGPHLGFADSKGGYGGLSEGVADFIAQIIVEHQTQGRAFPGKDFFRIINETGFYLTNEFHDEGEAYGGAMNDMLMTAISYEGKAGLIGFTDLTLEAMRLTRNHPALNAAGWFEHMLYADELGSSVRSPGKFHSIIVNALKARNFAFSKSFRPAKMKITFNNTELTNDSPASREKPLTLCGPNGIISYDLNLTLSGEETKFITFPAIVKVEYKKGALQGAIAWEGEDQNPQQYTVESENDTLVIPVKAGPHCEFINQPDGSCKDYAYIQIFNQESKRPVAKKRFYLKINSKEC
jgi:hypothetical protein